jgi:hypothetical protein
MLLNPIKVGLRLPNGWHERPTGSGQRDYCKEENRSEEGGYPHTLILHPVVRFARVRTADGTVVLPRDLA